MISFVNFGLRVVLAKSHDIYFFTIALDYFEVRVVLSANA